MRSDVGVLLVFFNKADTLKEVFEAVREAKPKKLFLAQDGARQGNEKDIENIDACRRIVEQVDWECEVYKNYSDKNLTCDPRVFSAITWAFETVEKLIIIEDDSVPNQSFFRFMDEILERYADDDRVQMVSGMERFGENRYCRDSYFFSTINAGCAWATWKRVWKDIVKYADCEFVQEEEEMHKVDCYVRSCLSTPYADFVEKGKKNLERNREIHDIFSWEYAVSTAMVLGNRLAINPRVNLVKNIGVTEGATHSGDSLQTMPAKIRRLFFMPTAELEFPLKHPKYMIRDMEYEKAYEKEFCYNKWQLFCMRIEHAFLTVKYKGIGFFISRYVLKKGK